MEIGGLSWREFEVMIRGLSAQSATYLMMQSNAVKGNGRADAIETDPVKGWAAIKQAFGG